jgi:hypothetical protein
MSKISRKVLRMIVLTGILVLSVLSFYIYKNFNRLISEAIMRSFSANVISDVYDLSFDHLSINIATGEVKIRNVVIAPKKVPLQVYPYINSSFVLQTKRIDLRSVDIYTLLKHNSLQASIIEIDKPEISIRLSGWNHLFFPFKTGENTSEADIKLLKKYLDSYFLKEFILRDASLTMEDEKEGSSYRIGELNILVSDIRFSQHAGVDSLTFKGADLGLINFGIHSKAGNFKSMKSANFELKIDSFAVQQRPDTVNYQVADYKTKVQDWDLVTADSVYVIGAKSVELSRTEKALHITGAVMRPTLGHEAFNQLRKYQKELYSISVKKVDLLNISLDSLRLYRTILIGNIKLDSADVLIYKDKTKEVDLKRLPEFPGQQLNSVGIPLTIKELKIEESVIEYQEKKTDGDLASVKIGRAGLSARNISNQMSNSSLSVELNGYLENKVPFDLGLEFSYKKPEFRFKGNLKPFELKDLNRVIEAFAPTSVKNGTVDAIHFSGNGYQRKASGDMEFLYHDLDLNIDLKKYSKFKNALITFAANNYLNSSNPVSTDKAARIVKFDVERDCNKGFMNLIIKSVVSGLQETMLPSKENRKLNRDTKKALKKEQKEQDKATAK